MLHQLQRISDNIYLVQGKNNGKFPFSHSILIFSDSNKAILIDTGCGIKNLQAIKNKYHIYS